MIGYLIVFAAAVNNTLYVCCQGACLSHSARALTRIQEMD